MNIAVIGMRGAGKSNVARRLSVFTKRPVLSTDTMIEYEAGGTSIPQLVAAQGWPAFREREYQTLIKIENLDGIIVDAGGGVVVDLNGGEEVFSARKVELLQAAGPVIWLRGDVSRLIAKVQAKGDRPDLVDESALAELMARRQPWYEAAATHIIDIEGKKREEIALEIVNLMGWEPAGSP